MHACVMKKFLLSIYPLLLLGCSFVSDPPPNTIMPGYPWRDTNGDAIHAHGGCMLQVKDHYYWYGQALSGPTRLIENDTWENYRCESRGISCYSSSDLLSWKNEGIVLSTTHDDPLHPLHISGVIERPKVIRHPETGQYVMWVHLDDSLYRRAQVGIAVSDQPEGPFRFVHAFSPHGEESRDMTVFQDWDGSAYLYYNSENNNTLHVSPLTSDYLGVIDTFQQIMPNCRREAPTLFRHKSIYYLITSGLAGWNPTSAEYAIAAHPMGPWTSIANPCEGPNCGRTFDSQPTDAFLFGDRWVFMADKWNKRALSSSAYIWLPIHIYPWGLEIPWVAEWTPTLSRRKKE